MYNKAKESLRANVKKLYISFILRWLEKSEQISILLDEDV